VRQTADTFAHDAQTADGRIMPALRKKPLMLRIITLVFGFFIMAVAPALAQQPLEPTKIRHIYDIIREGNKIGTDVVDIDKQGNTTTVTFTTHISVVVMFVEAYRFDHSSVETSTRGRFVSYKSRTNDNGTKHSVVAMAMDNKLDLTVDGEHSEFPQIILPAAIWNKDFINATELIDTDKGTILSVKVQDMGDEVIELNGADVQAHHYKITGDFQRDVWLVNDVPVRIKLLGSDHSTIFTDLRP
jgi:hypothetical protein